MHVFELPMEGFFIELNLCKTKWLLCCIYNPQKRIYPAILQEFRKILDVFSLKYSSVLIIGDFNAKTHICDLKNFCELNGLRNLVKQPICFKHLQNLFCTDLLLTNKAHSLCNTYLIETGFSDFHKMALTVFKGKFVKCKSKIVTYRASKIFLMKFFNRRFYLIWITVTVTMKVSQAW